MDELLDGDSFEAIDRACDRFEKLCISGEPRSIQEVLSSFTQPLRRRLLHELVQLDAFYRRKSGELVDLEFYCDLLPQYDSLLRSIDIDGFAAANDPLATTSLDPDRTVNRDGKLPPMAAWDVDTMARNSAAFNDEQTDGGKLPRRVRYFGDYELLDEIARGGMGVVYRARQVNLNRIVALKMILSGQLAGTAEVKRFYLEAEAAANLDHPGIVPVYEVGEHDGRHYFAMGFVKGQSLQDRIRSAPLEPNQIARLVVEIADAVHYAHQHHVIHRDLKPANVLLDAKGRARITDFGLAKRTSSNSELTATGQVLGTPSYMPPEQAKGDMSKVDAVSDVYSLGGILYSLLTSQPPFRAATLVETLRQVTEQEPVAPTKIDSSIPVDLETITLKCLQKEKSKRYASAKELSLDLERWLDGKPISARRVSSSERAWKWCRRNPAIAGLVSVALLLGVVASFVWRAKTISDRADRQTTEILVDDLISAPTATLLEQIEMLQSKRIAATESIREKLPKLTGNPLASALLALEYFGEDETASLVDSLRVADPTYFTLVAPRIKLSESKKRVARLGVRKQLRALLDEERILSQDDSIRLAQRATFLWQLEGGDYLRRAIASDSRAVASELILAQFELGTDPTALAQTLDDTATEQYLRFGLLALGHYDVESDDVVATIAEIYSQNPAASVHSASQWLLSRWGRDDLLQLAITISHVNEDHAWYVNHQLQTMIVFRGPVQFTMGSPKSELHRGDRERQHVREIPRSFAVAATEVTFGQFSEFLSEVDPWALKQIQKVPAKYIENDDLPMIGVEWYRAAHFCNWLSEKEGMPPSEWCYEPNGNGMYELGMRHADNHVSKSGYRMPTEAEWEYCCRAGRSECRSFGERNELARSFAWYDVNSDRRTHSVGSLMPNAFGFFDMHGNVSERCTDFAAPYSDGQKIRDAYFLPRNISVAGTKFRTRGSSFIDAIGRVRAALRFESSVEKRDVFVGFRVARTLPALQ